MKKVTDYLKQFHGAAEILSNVHVECIAEYYNLEKIVDGSLEKRMKAMKALFAEGLFLYAHTSLSKASLPGARAQLSQIAGEKINESDIQISLLKRARELVADP